MSRSDGNAQSRPTSLEPESEDHISPSKPASKAVPPDSGVDDVYAGVRPSTSPTLRHSLASVHPEPPVKAPPTLPPQATQPAHAQDNSEELRGYLSRAARSTEQETHRANWLRAVAENAESSLREVELTTRERAAEANETIAMLRHENHQQISAARQIAATEIGSSEVQATSLRGEIAALREHLLRTTHGEELASMELRAARQIQSAEGSIDNDTRAAELAAQLRDAHQELVHSRMAQHSLAVEANSRLLHIEAQLGAEVNHAREETNSVRHEAIIADSSRAYNLADLRQVCAQQVMATQMRAEGEVASVTAEGRAALQA